MIALGCKCGYNSNMEKFAFSPVDRAIIYILAALHAVNGLYLIGPWYITTDNFGGVGKSPLYSLFGDERAVKIYGVLLLLNALALAYSARRQGVRFLVAGWAVLSGFFLRLYALIGVFLTLDWWLPPVYASHIATVGILGVYWIWVKYNERTT